jgi:hypothetical protein
MRTVVERESVSLEGSSVTAPVRFGLEDPYRNASISETLTSRHAGHAGSEHGDGSRLSIGYHRLDLSIAGRSTGSRKTAAGSPISTMRRIARAMKGFCT